MFPNVQGDVCVMLVQFYGKCSCASYVMGARIFSKCLSNSVYKTTPKLPSIKTLRVSEY